MDWISSQHISFVQQNNSMICKLYFLLNFHFLPAIHVVDFPTDFCGADLPDSWIETSHYKCGVQVNLCQKLFVLQNMGRTCCVQKLFWMSKTISVHNMFSPCSAKRRASDKDLPVLQHLTAPVWVAEFLLSVVWSETGTQWDQRPPCVARQKI